MAPWPRHKKRETPEPRYPTIAEMERAEAAAALLQEEDLRRLWRLIRHEGAPADLTAARMVAALRETTESPHLIAEQLVRDTLPEAEYRSLQKDGYLDVPSASDANRRYRIYKNPSIQRTEIWQRDGTDGNKWTLSGELCVVPAGPGAGAIPMPDRFLTHYLLIKTDEERFCATANHFPASQAARYNTAPSSVLQGGPEQPVAARDWWAAPCSPYYNGPFRAPYYDAGAAASRYVALTSAMSGPIAYQSYRVIQDRYEALPQGESAASQQRTAYVRAQMGTRQRPVYIPADGRRRQSDRATTQGDREDPTSQADQAPCTPPWNSTPERSEQ